MSNKTLVKRKLCWVLPPADFECVCSKCGHNKWLAWSEYEGHVWCHRCKVDTSEGNGIFSGPIPIGGMKLMLGDNCFDKYDIETGRLYKFDDKAESKLGWVPTDTIFRLVKETCECTKESSRSQ